MTDSIFNLGFSRLAVGTVQFGLPYGVANRTGQPTYKEVCEILACAVANGATTLDTAATYGDSESVLGRALREIGALDRVTIVSKVRHLKTMEQEQTPATVEAWIRDSVVSSLERLGIDNLPVCLFHDPVDVAHMEILLALKEEGLVQHVGTSVISPDQMEMELATPGLEAIQIPMNMVDQRILRSGNLGRAEDAGMAVFVRSIYQQGLLLMPIDEIMPELQQVVPGVTSVLTGVETVEQMEANARIAAKGPLPMEVTREIDEAVPDLSGTIVFTPWLWPGAM